MAKGTPAASSPTTATPPSGALKRTTSSSQNMRSQKSILGFFQKSSPSTPSAAARRAEPASSPAERVSEQRGANATRETSKTPKPKKAPKFSQDLTPVPSSDLVGPVEEEEKEANGQVCCWFYGGGFKVRLFANGFSLSYSQVLLKRKKIMLTLRRVE